METLLKNIINYHVDQVIFKKTVFHHFYYTDKDGFILFFLLCTDSSGQVTSSPLGSPTSHRGMHPSLLSPTSMGPSGSLHSPISTLSSPMNGLASPFSVISSPMGPHSMNSPGMGYGPSVSPQVRPVTDAKICRKTHTRIHAFESTMDDFKHMHMYTNVYEEGVLKYCFFKVTHSFKIVAVYRMYSVTLSLRHPLMSNLTYHKDTNTKKHMNILRIT